MSARLPTQAKSPFELDARPLVEMSSPHAGLLATSRAFRSLKFPGLIAANLNLNHRRRGCAEAEAIEALVLLQTAVCGVAGHSDAAVFPWRLGLP